MGGLIDNVTVPEGSKGPWSVVRFDIPKEPSIAMFRLAMDGRGAEPGTYTKLVHNRRGLIMSDTPAERRDHYSFVVQATGRVLINGLGIGMCLAAVLKKPDVEHITVVEIDQDVIDLVGPHYASPRIEIIQSSAFDYQPPKGVRYGAVWHDIWDNICGDNLPEMVTLHRKYGRRTDWQGSWGRPRIERERASDRRNPWSALRRSA